MSYESPLSAWIEVFGRLHPALLHMPIGIVAALVALDLVALVRGRPVRELAPAESVLVWFAALAAWISVATGYTLSLEDGYEPARVQLHMRLGIASATGTSAVVFAYVRHSRAAYRAVLLATMGLVAAAGHFGSGLVRGDDFLIAPLAAAKPSAEARSTYRDTIAPILAARCGACHGETKQKGGLRLTTPETLFAGGDSGPAFVPGDPARSEMVRRAHLPLDDEEHMPPEGKTQLTPSELAAIEAWIAANAPLEGVVAGIEKTGAAPPEPAQSPKAAAASPAALDALRDALVHVAPIAAGSTLLEVDFSPVASATTDESLARLLEPLRDHVARLSLARCAITDAAIAPIARMPGLERLDLTSTAVTDAALQELTQAPALSDLVVVRTRLSDGAADALLDMPKLARVYVWRSGMSADAVDRLRRERPALRVEAGDHLASSPLETEPARASPAPINTACPVSGSPVDASYTLVFRERVIGFCCGQCPAKFSADPDAYASKLP